MQEKINVAVPKSWG